jgi:hypothetical protein
VLKRNENASQSATTTARQSTTKVIALLVPLALLKNQCEIAVVFIVSIGWGGSLAVNLFKFNVSRYN